MKIDLVLNVIFLLSSSKFEIVQGVLTIGVKPEKKLSSAEGAEYKVRMEHHPSAGGSEGDGRKNELDWIFTCTCRNRTCGLPPLNPICSHVGAALIVHFN